MNLDEYTASKHAYAKANPYGGDVSSYITPQDLVSGSADSMAANAPQDQWVDSNYQDWLGTMPAEQQAEYKRLAHEKYLGDRNKSRMAFLGAAGAMAAPGLLGMLGSGSADLGMAGWMGTGAGEMGLAPGAAGLASSGGGMGTLGALEGADMAGGLLPQFGSSGAYSSGLGMTNAGMGAIGDMIKQYGPDVLKLFGGGQGNQSGGGLLGNLGAAGAGILQNYYNNATMPGIPDYMKLAGMTGMSANPNQTNAQGDTSTWTIDPITGQRTQQVKYGQANQEAFDEQQAIMKALRNKVQLPQAALPPMQQFNPSSLQQVNPNAVWG